MSNIPKSKINWRKQILKEFPPECSRLTLVCDPDGLLVEEQLGIELKKRGFDVLEFEDPITFRFTYESRYRSYWDKGENTNSLVIISRNASFLNEVPYDLYQAGRKLSFSLGDLFPNFAYSVICELNKADLDRLYEIQEKSGLGTFSSSRDKKLGENATKDFILRHVFGIAPELIKQSSDLLWTLLRKHYQEQQTPFILDSYLIQCLRKEDKFLDWPLEAIVPDREAFFSFLQERWPIFLDSLLSRDEDSIRQDTFSHHLEYSGPRVLPFDHEDVRVYIDNLFVEGYLNPIEHVHADMLKDTWAKVGIVTLKDDYYLLEKLYEAVESAVQAENVTHNYWLSFASKWSELIATVEGDSETRPEKYMDRLKALKEKVDSRLVLWAMEYYGGLSNLPARSPVMVHHIPRFLSRTIEKDQGLKLALLVIDGLSFDQWISIRRALKKQLPKLLFREKTVFAWIPTITSVSRQSIFAGKIPFYFSESINNNAKEHHHWKRFWLDQGLTKHQVGYANVLGDDGDIKKIEEILSDPRLRVFGIVVRKVDKIMHGMELGIAGMHNQVRQWVREGFMKGLIELLDAKGFSVYLTSDHGNIEATGIGRPSEGVVADSRGERVRIYSDDVFRKEVKKLFPGAIEWPSTGLPEKYFPLIAPNRCAFVPKDTRIVGHGGITVEELIVPFIEMTWRN